MDLNEREGGAQAHLHRSARRMTPLMMAALLAVVFALTSCSSTSSAVPPMSSVTADESTAPANPHGLITDACDLDTIGAVQRVVAKQLAAFRTRDFAAALALASAQFKAIASVDDLRALVDDGRHPEVLDSAAHEFTDCRMTDASHASAVVTVTGTNDKSVIVEYLFVVEDDQWKILMSRPLSGHSGSESSQAPSLNA